MTMINTDDIQAKVLVLGNQRVILGADFAAFYGVENKRVNEAVKNNLDKFPARYIPVLTPQDLADLQSEISITKRETGQNSRPTQGLQREKTAACWLPSSRAL